MRKATFTARARWHKRSGHKKDIATYLRVSWLRKSYKLRIREKSDGVQNNPSRSINTIRHSVVCGTSRCPDAYLVYSFSQFNYYFGFHWLINDQSCLRHWARKISFVFEICRRLSNDVNNEELSCHSRTVQ